MRSILLDEYDVPKLSTFFFPCQSLRVKLTWKLMRAFGICGLSTPEFKASGKATEKSDVYNFGQLLLELLTGENSY
jgi:hypothetical protein